MKNRTTYIDPDLLVSPSQSDECVRVFQRKLCISAKKEKSYVAHSLYDKVYLNYLLIMACHLYKWMKGKGRKAYRKLRQRPYKALVKLYGLLDKEKYARLKTLSKAK